MVDRPEPEGAPEPTPRFRFVIETPIFGVFAVSLSQWRPDRQPDDIEIGWTTDTDGGW